MSAEPNLIPLGDFEFDQKCRIGAGSFATVYSGRSKSTGEPVAIKAVEMRRLNKKLQQNLEVEIAIMRDHCHPNLVKLHSVERGPDDQHVYLVMEFCSGGDLAGFLKKRGGHVPESTAREFTRHIATCLLYTSDAADEEDSVDLGGRRIIKKKKRREKIRKCDSSVSRRGL
eukprot:TRINITY_DN2721_c0_g1_i25.p1 TRINITY_DN2721_c0_g1~~TRINITY_DN2721_c0_g1_i25.p1  ORF type:complete len:171 (-),score=21.32 TRINITY_DN2721_c0_g1_i25:2-514(-)